MPDFRLNAMTVDVEDYFQVSAFESQVDRASWESTSLRVEKNVDRILEIFDNHSVKATFFTLGWIAQRCPGMVRRIVDCGHELASHGWEHVRVVNQTPDEFREDAGRTKLFLEDSREITGIRESHFVSDFRNVQFFFAKEFEAFLEAV